MLSIRGRNLHTPRVRVGVDRARGEVEVYGAMVDGPRGCGGKAVADAEGGCEILFFPDIAVGGKVDDVNNGQRWFGGGSRG